MATNYCGQPTFFKNGRLYYMDTNGNCVQLKFQDQNQGYGGGGGFGPRGATGATGPSGGPIGPTGATGATGAGMTGGGTLNRIVLWTPDGSTLGDSYFLQNGNSVTLDSGKVISSQDPSKSEIDFGTIGGEYVNISTDGGTDAEGFLYMDSTIVQLQFDVARVELADDVITYTNNLERVRVTKNGNIIGFNHSALGGTMSENVILGVLTGGAGTITKNFVSPNSLLNTTGQVGGVGFNNITSTGILNATNNAAVIGGKGLAGITNNDISSGSLLAQNNTNTGLIDSNSVSNSATLSVQTNSGTIQYNDIKLHSIVTINGNTGVVTGNSIEGNLASVSGNSSSIINNYIAPSASVSVGTTPMSGVFSSNRIDNTSIITSDGLIGSFSANNVESSTINLSDSEGIFSGNNILNATIDATVQTATGSFVGNSFLSSSIDFPENAGAITYNTALSRAQLYLNQQASTGICDSNVLINTIIDSSLNEGNIASNLMTNHDAGAGAVALVKNAGKNFIGNLVVFNPVGPLITFDPTLDENYKTHISGLSTFALDLDASAIIAGVLTIPSTHIYAGVINITGAGGVYPISSIVGGSDFFPIQLRAAAGITLTITGTAVGVIVAGQIALSTASYTLVGRASYPDYIKLQIEGGVYRQVEVSKLV